MHAVLCLINFENYHLSCHLSLCMLRYDRILALIRLLFKWTVVLTIHMIGKGVIVQLFIFGCRNEEKSNVYFRK